jgi:hypothetical protein
MKLQVGKTYIARDGSTHTMTVKRESTVIRGRWFFYNFGNPIETCWNEDGSRWETVQDPKDLIAEAPADGLTDWFDGDVAPAYIGWYDTRLTYLNKSERRYWNGVWWSYKDNATKKSGQQRWQWRGLARPAKSNWLEKAIDSVDNSFPKEFTIHVRIEPKK